MKKIQKTFALLLGLTTCISCFGACKNPNDNYDPANPDQIKIMVSNLGYGYQWTLDIAKAYEATHPGKKVEVEDTVMSSTLISQMEAGGFIGDICMFDDIKIWKYWRDDLMTQLDDVVNATPEGESESIEQKTNQTLINAYKVDDGHYYSVPWNNENLAICYNKTVLNQLFGEGQWSLPRTTQEMFDMCESVKDTAYGFVWSGTYFDLVGQTWTAQYTGYEEYCNYQQGYYLGTDGVWYLSDNAQCVEQNVGLLRMMEVIETAVKKYGHKYGNDMSHIQAQANLVGIPYISTDKKPVMFTPVGDWVYEETLEEIQATGHVLGFMKTPVISSIVETLSFWNEADGVIYNTLSATKKASYDAKLRALIDYADAKYAGTNPEKPQGVTDEDIERVVEARQIITGKSQAQAFIPANSQKKELAKDFLVFMASDMAVEIFSRTTNGYSPYIDTDGYKSITYENNDFMNEDREVLASSPLRVISAFKGLRQSGYTLPKLDRYPLALARDTAQVKFNAELAEIRGMWDDVLKNAGMSNLAGQPKQ